MPPEREINRAFPFHKFDMDGALKEILDDPLLVIKLHNSLYADNDFFFRPRPANLEHNYLPDDDIYFAIVDTPFFFVSLFLPVMSH